MKMTMTQFREWVAATEFSAEQGAELGSERARIKDEYETYPSELGTTWQGLTITDDDGEDLDERDQAAEIDEALRGKGFKAFDFDALLPPVITTDIDTKDLEEAVELIVLINNDAPDIRFQGELIAEASSDSNVSWSSGTGGRWTELKLYRTAGGRYVAQSIGRTKRQGEHTRYSAKVCETAADVIAFFGHGWLAKELYDDADIEDVQHVE